MIIFENTMEGGAQDSEGTGLVLCCWVCSFKSVLLILQNSPRQDYVVFPALSKEITHLPSLTHLSYFFWATIWPFEVCISACCFQHITGYIKRDTVLQVDAQWWMKSHELGLAWSQQCISNQENKLWSADAWGMKTVWECGHLAPWKSSPHWLIWKKI